MLRCLAEKIIDDYDCDWDNDIRVKEACVCSVENIMALAINILLLTIIAILLSKEKVCFIFFLTNGFIRIFSGGIHASTHTKCISTYIIIMLISIYLAEFLQEIPIIFFVLSIMVPCFSIAVNFKYGGMQKKLEIEDNLKYSSCCKRMVLIFNSILICAGLMDLLSQNGIGISLRNIGLVESFALIVQSVSLLLARQNCYNSRNEVMGS